MFATVRLMTGTSCFCIYVIYIYIYCTLSLRANNITPSGMKEKEEETTLDQMLILSVSMPYPAYGVHYIFFLAAPVRCWFHFSHTTIFLLMHVTPAASTTALPWQMDIFTAFFGLDDDSDDSDQSLKLREGCQSIWWIWNYWINTMVSKQTEGTCKIMIFRFLCHRKNSTKTVCP